jgi:hypothetical protein
MTEPSDTEYELVVPFVVVASKGGRHDDDAFVAGWRLGRLDCQLSLAALIGISRHTAVIPPADMPQVDLIAMQHGYTVTYDPWQDAPDDWAAVTFSRTGEPPSTPEDVDA